MGSWVDDVDNILGKKFINKSDFGIELINILRRGAVLADHSPAKQHRNQEAYRIEKDSFKFEFCSLGGIMDRAVGMMAKVNDEVEKSKDNLQKLFNDCRSTSDLLLPELVKMVRGVRDSRMTVTTELQKALKIMKDVRSFFLESEYTIEIERLERFVVLAERMKVLIGDGTLDAICDVTLKLAVGKEDVDGAERESS